MFASRGGCKRVRCCAVRRVSVTPSKPFTLFVVAERAAPHKWSHLTGPYRPQAVRVTLVAPLFDAPSRVDRHYRAAAIANCSVERDDFY